MASMQQQSNSRARVLFWDLEGAKHLDYQDKLRSLLKQSRIGSCLQGGELTAIKLHFGERGNPAFLSPQRLAPVVRFLRKCGARPFMTDTCTLYGGPRSEGVSHGLLAAEHGFDQNILQAPVVIADGIRGTHQVEVSYRGLRTEVCYLAGEIAAADSMLTCSHFTGHRLSGFAGALKNLAMGCASRQGKMRQHSSTAPRVHADKCRGCGSCVSLCPTGALSLTEQGQAQINPEPCHGCALCLSVCPAEALAVHWDRSGAVFAETMADYAGAALSLYSAPVLHMSFLLSVTPECDCESGSARPLCPDLGIAASYDPVALDQACLDLVNTAPSTPKQGPATPEGGDVFLQRHPGTPGDLLLQAGQRLGIGSRSYRLIRV